MNWYFSMSCYSYSQGDSADLNYGNNLPQDR